MMDKEVVVAATAREAVGEEAHMTVLIALLAMIVKEDKLRIVGSASGRRKSKKRMEGYSLLG
jgi:hypothetical protein